MLEHAEVGGVHPMIHIVIVWWDLGTLMVGEVVSQRAMASWAAGELDVVGLGGVAE